MKRLKQRTPRRRKAGEAPRSNSNPWHRRQRRNLGLQAPSGQPVPLIDQVHKLMHLWRAGDQVKVDDYLGDRGLQRNTLFNQILQALIELADEASEERSILEALSNHVVAQGDARESGQRIYTVRGERAMKPSFFLKTRFLTSIIP